MQSAQPDELSKGERTRQQLLEAGYRQFVDKGYHGASMRSIALDGGITAGAIYNHFASKEDLFRGVVLRFHPLTQVLPRLTLAEGETFEQVVRDAAARFWAELQADPGVLNLMLIELVECKGRHLPDLAQAILTPVTDFSQGLPEISTERHPTTALARMRILFTMLLAYFMTDRMLIQSGAPGEILTDLGDLEDFIHVYLHGVLTQERDLP